MVMTGHHYLTSIDDVNPVSMSKKVERLIRGNLKNSVIISDELSMMKAYSNYSLERAIIDSISDIRMVHSGLSFDLISRRDEIYSAINKLNKDRVQYSLRKVLELKSKYGLIEIKKIKNDSQ
jgi:beta-glucosidase-like glycosyl hydrolase